MILLLPLLLLVHLLLLVSTRFTLWPEMVVYPYLLSNGFSLYRDIINPYMPSFIYVLALLEKLFRVNPTYFQAFTWAVILAIDILIFIIAKRLTAKAKDAMAAVAFFVIFSIPFSVNNLWFDLIQTPFIVMSCYFFYRFLKDPSDKKSLFASSIFFTIAFFIKQQAVWLAIYFALVLIFRFGKKSISLVLSQPKIFAPPAIFFLMHVLFFTKLGLLSDFLFWTVYLPFFKASSMPGYVFLPNAKQVAVIFVLFLIFIPLLFSKNTLKFFVLGAFSLLMFAYPRFDYFHLIPAVAVLSLVMGTNLANLFRAKNPDFQAETRANFEARKREPRPRGRGNLFSYRKIWLSPATISIISVVVLLAFSARYFSRNWTREIRFFEGEIYQTANLIRRIAEESDPIYIQNGPDQILPLADRLPTKPWADEFPWYLEIGNTQERVLAGIKNQNPKYIIFKPYEEGPEFQIGAYHPDKIATYIDQNYQNLLQINNYFWLKIKK